MYSLICITGGDQYQLPASAVQCNAPLDKLLVLMSATIEHCLREKEYGRLKFRPRLGFRGNSFGIDLEWQREVVSLQLTIVL